MYRKLGLLLAVAAILSVAVAVSADPLLPGCYVDAPASVDEGQNFTATVTCNDISDAVFGFEFGTAFSSTYATVVPTTYTPGSFVTGANGGVEYEDHIIEVRNSLAGLYAVSRQGSDTATGDFTLGSFEVTVPFGLTGGNSSATVTLPEGTFKLSNNFGVALNWRQSSPDAEVTINDLLLALLDGTVTVESDGSMNNLRNISLTVGSPTVGTQPSTRATDAGSSADFAITGFRYLDVMNQTMTVTMDSHLACTEIDTLVDGANDAASAIGTLKLYAGDVTSLEGDSAINIQDAAAVGTQFGSTTPTGEVDINGDGKVDIYDLVHIGRNYNRGDNGNEPDLCA